MVNFVLGLLAIYSMPTWDSSKFLRDSAMQLGPRWEIGGNKRVMVLKLLMRFLKQLTPCGCFQK